MMSPTSKKVLDEDVFQIALSKDEKPWQDIHLSKGFWQKLHQIRICSCAYAILRLHLTNIHQSLWFTYHSPLDYFFGRAARTWTGTSLRTADFESAASAIPPQPHIIVCNYKVCSYHYLTSIHHLPATSNLTHQPTPVNPLIHYLKNTCFDILWKGNQSLLEEKQSFAWAYQDILDYQRLD